MLRLGKQGESYFSSAAVLKPYYQFINVPYLREQLRTMLFDWLVTTLGLSIPMIKSSRREKALALMARQMVLAAIQIFWSLLHLPYLK